jgi:mono/diheme cytochrome c family protein
VTADWPAGERRGARATRVVRQLAALGAIAGSAACGRGGPRSDAGDSSRPSGDSSKAGPPDSGRAGGVRGPADTVRAPDATRILAADSAAGYVLYFSRGRCAPCHGARGEGIPRLGSDLRDARWIIPDGSVAGIAAVILSGVSVPVEQPIAMPSYRRQLSPIDAFRIAAYVYTMSHRGVVVKDSALAGAGVLARPPVDTAKPPND